MTKSTTAPGNGKPDKPRPDFPLFRQATGRWAKKVCGRLCYFGPWADPQKALNKWLDEQDDLLAGRKPRTRTGAATVAFVVNHFLTYKQGLVSSGELAQRTFDRYYAMSAIIVDALGRNRAADHIGPADLASLRGLMAKRWRRNRIRRAPTPRGRSRYSPP